MGFKFIRKSEVSPEEFRRLEKARKRQAKMLKRMREKQSEEDRKNQAWLAQNTFGRHIRRGFDN